jgi:thiamine kinase-like enzyme
MCFSEAWTSPQKVLFKNLPREKQLKIKEALHVIYPYGVEIKELLWMNQGSMDQVFKVTLGSKNGNQVLGIRLIGRPDYGKKRTLERSRMAAEIGVGAPVYSFSKDASVLITKWAQGEEIKDFDHENSIYFEKLIEALRLFHNRYQHTASFAEPYAITERCKNRTKELIKDFPTEKESLEAYLKILDTIERALSPFEKPQPIHGDVNLENVLITPQKEIIFIDWGDSVTSDPYDDLGAFAHHFGLTNKQETDVLRSYLKREPSSVEVSKLYLKRLCSLYHHAAWAYIKYNKLNKSQKLKEFNKFPWGIQSKTCFSLRNKIKENCSNSHKLEGIGRYQEIAFLGFEEFLCQINSKDFKRHLDVLIK